MVLIVAALMFLYKSPKIRKYFQFLSHFSLFMTFYSIGNPNLIKFDRVIKIIKKVYNSAHDQVRCGDLKIVAMILGQQMGFTKLLCFICEWDNKVRDS